ncbi:unnamed protein product [Cuscuta campestris]|uniref:Uncharacterized protein n=1 Tax=Cuscuta campestris TaxID=132261 RepID=A0A484LE69_9ASTE|nr:unnamed protein product [Cuscuta campestris]
MAGSRLFRICFIPASLLLFLIFIPALLTNHPGIVILRPATSFFVRATPVGDQKDRRQYPVSFAYLISASRGDLPRLRRLLHALYHPGNYYLIHLDADAPRSEHRELARFVAGNAVFVQIGNVWVVGKPSLVTYRGPTMLAATLHAMSVLLRTANWDWFINLSASDYPLVTQDDLIQSFSTLPRDLNFIQHTSRLGWKFNKRGKPIMLDPGLHSSNKSEIWWAIKQKRTLPTAFKLYTGSAWTVLSRSFAEYCIVGWDNLPRRLLLYYTNFVSSPEGYFQTVVCNSEAKEGYKNTTVDHDLHYITWDVPPKQHPRSLGLRDYRRMVLSNRPFARKFKRDDPVLDKIDRELLKRRSGEGHFSLGAWCLDEGRKTCSALQSEKYGLLVHGSGARRLKTLLGKLLSPHYFSKRQCR